MIVHIFVANWIQLSPSVSKGFISLYSDIANQYVMLYSEKNVDKAIYEEIYTNLSFSQFEFCESYFHLIKFLFGHRRDSIIFHFGRYHWFLAAIFLGCTNINWVCWGSGTQIRSTKKSHLMVPIKKFIYQRFNSIVTLMEPDRDSIIKNFGVNPIRIKTIPYTSVQSKDNLRDLLCKELMEKYEIREKPVVLLGNSPLCIKKYVEMLPRLMQYKGKIEIQCMLNYCLTKDNRYEELVQLGKTLFGEDFKCNEDFHEGYKNYVNYMNTCDIYICSAMKQTGLGAIGTCLRLGKKIYITGNNMDWIKKEYKSIVFSADDINEGLVFEDFAKPLTRSEMLYNYKSVTDKYEERTERWRNYLKEIDGSSANYNNAVNSQN